MSNLMTVSATLKSPRFDTAGPRLHGQVKSVAALPEGERDEMHALLGGYFANTSRRQFDLDLDEKEWVILLRDAANRVQGFSTLMRMNLTIDGQTVVVFFSGDTIIHREYWGETALPRLWGQHVFSLADRIKDARVYWFLICSGYKTYRYLPLFFRDFYPNYEQPTPAPVKQTLDQLGLLKFGQQYDTARGVIRFRQPSPLQSGVAEITPQRLKDPHVTFFIAANPGHASGDELACLTELSRANLTAAGKRMVGKPDQCS